MRTKKRSTSMDSFESRTGGNRNVPPQTLAIGHLTMTDGDELDLLSNMSPKLARGVFFCELYASAGSEYAQEIADALKRMSVSKDGEGREGLIKAVKAGGELPGEYYQSRAMNFTEIEEGEDGTQDF